MRFKVLLPLVALMTHCVEAPGVVSRKNGPGQTTYNSQSGGGQLISAVSTGGVTSGQVSQSSTSPQELRADSSSSIAGASIVFPVGALAVSTTVSVQVGASLATTDQVAALGIAATVANAAPTVVVTSSTAIDPVQPMTIAIPLPRGSALMLDSDPNAKLVVFYQQVHAAAGTVTIGLLGRDALTVVGTQVLFQAKWFGAYQAAVTTTTLASNLTVDVASTAPIVTQSGAVVVTATGQPATAVPTPTAVAAATPTPTSVAPPAAATFVAGLPAATDRSPSLGITVGGAGVSSFKFKVGATSQTTCADGLGYTTLTPVSTMLTADISGVADGSVTLCLLGANAAGTLQTTPSAYSWVKKSTLPPATGPVLVSAVQANGAHLAWNASGGSAVGYLVLRRATAGPIPFTPTAGTVYAVGATVGGPAPPTTVVALQANTAFQDTGLSSGSTYTYVVYAYDSIYNYSLPSPPQTASYLTDTWTWLRGSEVINSGGYYGPLDVPTPSNLPVARNDAATATDSLGNLWMFGGQSGTSGARLGDLWEFNGTDWVWRGGSPTTNVIGAYGPMGTASPSNQPGARSGGVAWFDSAGHFMLFGGYGYDSAGTLGYLDDLWKWDGTSWIWISGETAANSVGSYGVKGTTGSGHYPSGRDAPAVQVTSTGSVYLFGGNGNCLAAGATSCNDLWKWDGSNWTWVGGDHIAAAAAYGTLGVAGATNIPGGRLSAASWLDASNHLWLFGGYGNDASGTTGYLDDLWMWDGSNWTWMRGSTVVNTAASFGSKNVTAATNDPGARQGSVAVLVPSGMVYLLAGQTSYDPTSELSDIWRWDGSNWTWVSGSSSFNLASTYGMLQVAESATTEGPGARFLAMGWAGLDGSIYYFGGYGLDYSSNSGNLNDLWKYSP